MFLGMVEASNTTIFENTKKYAYPNILVQKLRNTICVDLLYFAIFCKLHLLQKSMHSAYPIQCFPYAKTEFLSCLQCYKARALQVLTNHLSNLFIIGKEDLLLLSANLIGCDILEHFYKLFPLVNRCAQTTLFSYLHL